MRSASLKILGNVVKKRKKLRKNNIIINIKRNCFKQTTLTEASLRGGAEVTLTPLPPLNLRVQKRENNQKYKSYQYALQCRPTPPDVKT
jgi:hypothetical protein